MAGRPLFDSLLFDLDGTLIDSRADLAAAVNHALVAVGQAPRAEADITPHIGNGMHALLRGVLGSVSDDEINVGVDAFVRYYEAHCLDQTTLYDGVRDGLAFLGQSLKLAVVTNKPIGFTEKILSGLGIRGHLQSVIGGDTLPQRKPHPAPVVKALEDIGSSAARSLMVGDGTQDMSAGQAAGVPTCLALYGYGSGDVVLDFKPTYAINAFSDIKEIVS